jgi:Lysyl oxidase
MRGITGTTRALGALLLALTTLLPITATAPEAAAAPGSPSLRLLAAQDRVRLVRRSHREPVSLNLGVYVASVGGAFELHVGRADYDSPIEASQVVGGVDVPLPDSAIDGFNGLKDFTTTTLTNADGEVKSRLMSTWCPAAYTRGRVNGSGPLVDPFPAYGCPYNPFTIGTVMGVARGWAAALVDPYGGYYGAPTVDPSYARVPDGTYAATVSIRQPFRTLFGISDEDASVGVSVKVVTRRCRRCGIGGTPRGAAPERPAAAPRDVPTDLTPNPATLPDLIPLPASQMFVEHQRGHDYLIFGATVWNAGPAPMVVEGFRRPDSDTMDAWQYFFDHHGHPVGKAPVGGMEYDRRPGHQHWHFEQFARYTLTDADKTAVVRSHKEAFCLAPTDPIDLLAPSAVINPYPIGLSSACGDAGAIWVRESLPAGWGDTYFQYLPGQSFDVTDLPNGRYFVEVLADPQGSIFESDTTNDVSYRRIILRGRPGRRWVLVPAWHGLDGPVLPGKAAA